MQKDIFIKIFNSFPSSFLEAVTKNYHFNIELIDKLENQLNWKFLSQNTNLDWTYELVKRYESYWDWTILSKNESLPWSVELLDVYKDKWNWESFRGNSKLPWSKQLFRKFPEKLSFKMYYIHKEVTIKDEEIEENFQELHMLKFGSLKEVKIKNIELILKSLYNPSSVSLIDDVLGFIFDDDDDDDDDIFRDVFGDNSNDGVFDYIVNTWANSSISQNENINWTSKIIEKYKHKLSWDKLSSNKSLPWSKEFLNNYSFTSDKYRWDFKELSNNPNAPLYPELIIKLKTENWNFKALQIHPKLLGSKELFKVFSRKWDWNKLSESKKPFGFEWSEELIDNYIDKWDFTRLTSNKNITWNSNLLEKYKYKMDPLDQAKMSIISFEEVLQKSVLDPYFLTNKNVPWTINLIDKYLVNKGSTSSLPYLCRNNNIFWSSKLISKFANYWNWSALSIRTKVEWNEEVISKFVDYWDWYKLSANEAIKWNTKMILKFASKLDWQELLGIIEIEWDEKLINELTRYAEVNELKIRMNKSIKQKQFSQSTIWQKRLLESGIWDYNAVFNSEELTELLFTENLNDDTIEFFFKNSKKPLEEEARLIEEQQEYERLEMNRLTREANRFLGISNNYREASWNCQSCGGSNYTGCLSTTGDCYRN